MSLVIAGERSGVGKTTITLALLASLRRRNLKVQSFKVGPDYIDQMFHHYVTGLPCRNLDPVLTSPSYVQQCFARHTEGVEYALVEGVMGLYDGVLSSVIGHSSFVKKQVQMTNDNGQMTNFASTAHIARLLNLPVLLVIDCSRLSGSVAAIAQGYRSLDPKIKLAGVILNRVGSDRHLELLKNALEPLNLPILGVLRRQANITIPDRHLGLVPTAELPELDNLIHRLAYLGDTCFDWEQLSPLVKCRSIAASETGQAKELINSSLGVRIAVARDRAFNFYYQDNLDLLEELGAELIFWSPLNDRTLPNGVQGLYFGGGFPEIFAEELGANLLAIDAVRTAILSGIPTYAECGGLMYLCQQIIDFDHKSWPMVGILPTNAVMGKHLTLGYRKAKSFQDSPLLTTGVTVTGHEFHRSSLTIAPINPLFEVQGYNASSLPTKEGWRSHACHASYIHLHFGDRPEIAARFLQHCSGELQILD